MFGPDSLQRIKERSYVQRGRLYDKLLTMFSLTPKTIKGEDAISYIKRSVLPHPKDSQIYAEMIMSIDPLKEYKHIELVALFDDIFRIGSKFIRNDMTIYRFKSKSPSNVIAYWVIGPKSKVEDYVSKVGKDHPYQMFSSELFPSESKEEISAWIEHLNID